MQQNTRLFQALESKFLTFADLKPIPVQDNGEALAALSNTNIHISILPNIITPSTGNDIYVRCGLIKKLEQAQINLSQIMPNTRIDVVYGYRSPEIQLKTYLEIKNKISKEQPNLSADELDETIHRFIAVPEVAGHPTGGAVDVRLRLPSGDTLDMGTNVHEFTKNSYSFFPFISRQAWHNRQMLRQAMLSAGFAPFDGEWWHFSYGDKEWAKYYNRPYALYGQTGL